MMTDTRDLNLKSTITCPVCEFKKTETMPTDSCQVVYSCEGCKVTIQPKSGDCCVFCSFGTTRCPPIQHSRPLEYGFFEFSILFLGVRSFGVTLHDYLTKGANCPSLNGSLLGCRRGRL